MDFKFTLKSSSQRRPRAGGFVLTGKGRLFGIAGIAVLLAFCLWGVARSYPRYKEQRLTTQARLLLKEGKHNEARLTTQQLLRSNPRSPDACRFMAELTERAQDPSTLVWRRRVVELSPTLEDRLLLAAAGLLFEPLPYPLAQQTLEGIPTQHRESAAYHLISAQLALKLKRLEDAETHCRELIKLEPQRESHQLNLAVVRLQSKDQQAVADARATLERLAARPKLRSSALRALVSEGLARNNLERAKGFSEQLLSDPQAGFVDRVQHLRILRDSHNPAFDTFLAAVRTEASTNELQAYRLASWMNSRGLATEALEWIETLAPTVKSKQPVPKAVVECLHTKKDWAKLESYLNAQQWGGQDFVRLALLALALRNQDVRESSELRLQAAVRLASKHAETLAVLSQTLESWGWQAEADELRQLLVKTFPTERWAFQAVYQAFYARGDTPALYEVCRTLLKSGPVDAPIKNNFAVFCLLLNTNVNQAHLLAEEAYRAEPRNPGFVSTRAFSLHLQGKNSEALALLQTLPDADLETPGIALYYAIALAAAGEGESAQKYFSLAEHAQLLPEEKRLRDQARTRR